MEYRYIECEAFTSIIDKKDCSYHQRLGWSRTDWHTHNRGQLIYAEYGIMRLYVGEKIYYVPSWHAAWIPQGIRHKVVTESQDLLFHTLYLDQSMLQDPFYKEISVFPVSNMLREMILFTEKWPMLGEANEQESSFLQSIKYLLADHSAARIQLHVPVPGNEVLQNIIRQIESKLDGKMKAGELARQFGLSERTMHRLFLKELGMSYTQYLQLMRMVKAAELLSIAGMGVSEAAYAVGYESIPSFTRSFREVMGNAPGRMYRQAN
ncbi:helix-turn-helix transcriptional regulator [Flavihumibacter rivuli]|uniref:AraC family transcriptional regulator n=1 Tax=Flavihumibacter rivuli TaxID=2838156 RepID=UPI001BDED5A7|nr:helix-turn-helix transcriptional regulator [Flavihumibacter rivuli]ULQ55183.1 helix-turn-helix transcriptional regulator [Flavihumibacter rivuli]